MAAAPLRIDLHLHSCFSPDSTTRLDELVARCRELGLDRIALTDHHTAEGALELRRREPELAIVGEEVASTEGDIIGLFVTASIPSGGTPEEVCDAIHAMGGLTYACHPLDRRRSSFTPERLVELAPRFDIIETHNAWADAAANQAAAELCRDLGRVAATGSDSHSARDLGSSWMEIEPYDGAVDFLRKLGAARHVITERSGRDRRS
ncbi:MAG: PHP domain-containing protein [Candidatus Dormibacteraeota bacterium]|nr:PHP domain-containing protein [Candidatus Dormibacteraeota bacterium]